MNNNLNAPCRALLAGLILAAAACSGNEPVAGTEELNSAAERQLVVMEPVQVETPDGRTQTEYRRKVVQLRPVGVNEPIDPAFAQASFRR